MVLSPVKSVLFLINLPDTHCVARLTYCFVSGTMMQAFFWAVMRRSTISLLACQIWQKITKDCTSKDCDRTKKMQTHIHTRSPHIWTQLGEERESESDSSMEVSIIGKVLIFEQEVQLSCQ